MLFLVERDARNLSGVEGTLNEERGIGSVVDDVDIFIVQLAHDAVDAAALHAHAGTYGVNAVVVALNGNFSALARNACDAAEADEAVGDFGDFRFEQALQEHGRGAREVNLRVAVGIVHTVDDGAHGVALMEEVAGNLLRLGQVKFVALVVHEERLALPRLVNLGSDDFAHAVLIFIV